MGEVTPGRTPVSRAPWHLARHVHGTTPVCGHRRRLRAVRSTVLSPVNRAGVRRCSRCSSRQRSDLREVSSRTNGPAPARLPTAMHPGFRENPECLGAHACHNYRHPPLENPRSHSLRHPFLPRYSDHSTQQISSRPNQVSPIARPGLSQVMVRMVDATVKFPKIHTLRRRCLCVLRGHRIRRARVEGHELELGPRVGLRGRRSERGIWLQVRRYSHHHRRLNRSCFPSFGLGCDCAHGLVAEPVVDVCAPQLDLSAPRPPADRRQAAQQHNNRRGHGDGEDADGAVDAQRARRPLRGRRGRGRWGRGRGRWG